MSEDCCCDDPKNPTRGSPTRESGGSALTSGLAGPAAVALMGTRGVEPGGGLSALKGLAVGPNGELMIQIVDGLPVLANGVLVIDNATLRINNGRIASVTTTSSGTVTWTADAD